MMTVQPMRVSRFCNVMRKKTHGFGFFEKKMGEQFLSLGIMFVLCFVEILFFTCRKTIFFLKICLKNVISVNKKRMQILSLLI